MSRSRLQALREERVSAAAGRDALEQKLELLRREVQRRSAECEKLRAEAAVALQEARAALDGAQVELGKAAVSSAALAQPRTAAAEWKSRSQAGVQVPKISGSFAPFRARYGPGGTAASLDEAGRAYAAVLPRLCALAGEEAAVRALRRGQLRTALRLNALEKAVLPAVDAELRTLAAALEEEERDESVRRKAWMAAR